MNRREFSVAALALVSGSALAAGPNLPPGLDPQNTLLIEVKGGTVIMKLRQDLAPLHVERVKILARRGFYNGVVFHRVIEGFMAQTGDPTGTGSGGSNLPDLKAEFTKTPFIRGTVGMARTQDPNTANSQFFICFEKSSFLDGKYTVLGEIVSGMELIDRLKKGAPGSGQVTNPDKMIKVQVAADVK